jgi:hypothetical protein
MLFEILKNESGTFYAEKIPFWRNNPDCVNLISVVSEEEAQTYVRNMNAIAAQKRNSGASESGASQADAKPQSDPPAGEPPRTSPETPASGAPVSPPETPAPDAQVSQPDAPGKKKRKSAQEV